MNEKIKNIELLLYLNLVIMMIIIFMLIMLTEIQFELYENLVGWGEVYKDEVVREVQETIIKSHNE